MKYDPVTKQLVVDITPVATPVPHYAKSRHQAEKDARSYGYQDGIGNMRKILGEPK